MMAGVKEKFNSQRSGSPVRDAPRSDRQVGRKLIPELQISPTENCTDCLLCKLDLTRVSFSPPELMPEFRSQTYEVTAMNYPARFCGPVLTIQPIEIFHEKCSNLLSDF
jgi:hypothetical protein